MNQVTTQDKLIKLLPLFIILNTLWGVFGMYTEHEERMRQVEGQKPALVTQMNRARKDINQIKEFKKNLETSKTRLEEISRQAEQIQKQLPAQISDGEMLELFSGEARALNVLKVQIIPQDEVNKGAYFTKNYGIKGLGTFLQFLIFFERISSMDRIINVTGMNLNLANTDQRGRHVMVNMEANMQVFRYNPKGFEFSTEKL